MRGFVLACVVKFGYFLSFGVCLFGELVGLVRGGGILGRGLRGYSECGLEGSVGVCVGIFFLFFIFLFCGER